MENPRIIAFYLPQFHPIPENDEWWGKGFTEWTNVTKAKPVFKGHYQPHLPADLGFYDLRLPEVREQQAAMAKEAGIYGFCYYHYWFNGKRLLERPFNEVLESGKPDFPFMLCWANENWTRRWDGKDEEILMQQNYNEEDDLNHIAYLLDNVFSDARYIRIDGKPVFCIYRSTSIPNIKRTIEIWRNEASKKGIELYLCRVESHAESGSKYFETGFDAAIDFQPICTSLTKYREKSLFQRILRKIGHYTFNISRNQIIKYKKYVEFVIKQNLPADYKQYPCVCPMWDNTSRREKKILIFKGSTPDIYKKWLNETVNKFIPFSDNENFIFINAWNEWAEGNHLEPDRKWGNKYLDVTKEVLSNTHNKN